MHSLLVVMWAPSRGVAPSQWCNTATSISVASKLNCSHPWMFHNLRNSESVINISVKHSSDQVDTIFGEGKERNTKRMIEYFIDVVEGVLLVYNGVEKNPKSPNVLFFPPVRLSLENFRGSVVYGIVRRNFYTNR
jgi:hypothetical protein